MRVRDLFDIVTRNEKPYADRHPNDETYEDRADLDKRVKLWEQTRGVAEDVVKKALALGIDVEDYAPEGSPTAEAWKRVKAVWGVQPCDLRVGDRVVRPSRDPKFEDLSDASAHVTVRIIEPDGTVWLTPYGFTNLVRPHELTSLYARLYGRSLTEIIRLPADWAARRAEYTRPSFWLTPEPAFTPVTDDDWVAYAKKSLARQGWPSSTTEESPCTPSASSP